jgi:hypothetical protein
MKKVMLFAAVSLLTMASCKKDNDEKKEKVFKGAVQTFQHGKAWTWYEVDNNGKPVRLAIAVDDEAMASLDRSAPGDHGGGHSHNNSLSLKLHPKAGDTPFDHILVDWNPQGHPPAPIYDKAHFDFHFYTSTEQERMAIPVYEQDSIKFKNFPAAGYMPQNYVPIPGGVPQMGTHWVDVTSGELNGQPFGQTFLYGSYNGKVTFYEPMITEAFLKNNASFERTIPQPAKYAKAGWYPAKMRIEKKSGATHIILEQFTFKQAS